MLYWTAVAIPVVIALLMFGYSDQAPVAMRDFIAALDAQFGYPLLTLLKAIASR